jgi:hypothetical protein
MTDTTHATSDTPHSDDQPDVTPAAAPLAAWEPPRVTWLGSLAETTGGILDLS